MAQTELVSLPTYRLATISHRGPYHEIGPAFEKLGDVLGKAQAWGDTRGMLGVYHDDPGSTAPENLRSQAAVIMADGAEIPAGLEEMELPAGRYAVLHFKGPYDGLGEAWMGFTPDKIAALGATMRDGPALEIYRNDPATTAPEALLTDLCISVD